MVSFRAVSFMSLGSFSWGKDWLEKSVLVLVQSAHQIGNHSS